MGISSFRVVNGKNYIEWNRGEKMRLMLTDSQAVGTMRSEGERKDRFRIEESLLLGAESLYERES